MATRRKVNVSVEFSAEAKNALAALDADITALKAMVTDLIGAHSHLAEMIRNEVTIRVDRAAENGGATTWAEIAPVVESEPEVELAPEPEPKGTPLPDAMHHTPVQNTEVGEEERIRSTPFTRAPRATQVEWLISVLADGEWHAPISIAREYATDEKHLRYMRGAVTQRLLEMAQEGLAERQESHVRGSMFEYRLKEGS